MNLKKRLGSLVPGDARNHLQNVLTVEWSGHKTVLVEVPQSSSQQSDELEMAGMSSSRSGRGRSEGYGRLADDDGDADRGSVSEWGREEQEDKFVTSRLGRNAVGLDTEVAEMSPSKARNNRNARGHRQHGQHGHGQHRDGSPSGGTTYHLWSEPSSNRRTYGANTPDLVDLDDEIYTNSSPPRSPRQFRSNNPFANPFSHDDDFAAASVGQGGNTLSAATTGTSLSRNSSGNPHVYAERPWDRDDNSRRPSFTSSLDGGLEPPKL